MRLAIEPAIEQALAADEPVRDELQGLSKGTVLAAIVRPAGGVLFPRTTSKDVELMVAKPQAGGERQAGGQRQAGGEMWPIGWPPEEKDETKIVPAPV